MIVLFNKLREVNSSSINIILWLNLFFIIFTVTSSFSQSIDVLGTNEDKFYVDEPIIINDFVHFIPNNSILVDSIAKEKWNMRIKTWFSNSNDVVLNPYPNAPQICYPLKHLKGKYKIFVGVRAVSATSKFAVSFTNQNDSIIIDPPIVAVSHDYDLEIELPNYYSLSNDTLKILNLNYLAYIRYFKFYKLLEKTHPCNILSNKTILEETGKHIAFPGICISKTGKLFIVAREGRTHVSKDDYGTIVLISSNDTGLTWGNKKYILKESGIDYRDPAITSTSDNVLFLSYHSSGKESKSGMLKSTNEGKSWIDVAMPKDIFSPNGVVEYRGNLYYCGIRKRINVNYIEIITSSDKGNSWSEYSTIAMSKTIDNRWQSEVFDEPALAIISDSLWICGMRVDLNGYIYESISHEKGESKTWSYPSKTKIVGTPPHYVQLNEDNLLCSYGRRKIPFGIRASIYDIKKEQWQISKEIILENNLENIDLGYAKAVHLNDGTIVTVYYISDAKGETAEVKMTMWQLKE